MLGLLLPMCAAGPLVAQTTGAIAGHVRDRSTGAAIHGAQVVLDRRLAAVTDSGGAYVVRGVRSGWHQIVARIIGFATATRDSVPVRADETTSLDILLEPQAVQLGAVTVQATPDPVLDPLATATAQVIGGDELRHLPVSTLEEAVALTAGSVGGSYRGGRLGEQAFILDGLGLKNQLDASTGALGVRIPPDILTEAALITNGFSARYGQALSGMVNVVTKDGGERWQGRAAYESDRAAPASWDHGLDRLVVEADGPLVGGARLLGALDATGRLDADPVNAPAPADPRDPRTARPSLLPHNSGEQLDAAAKLTVPLGGRHALRLFGLHSTDQRLLFDPAFKYDPAFAPAQRVSGDLLSAHLQLVTPPSAWLPVVADVRVGYFAREFERGTLDRAVPDRFGAFTFGTYRFIGEALARSRDTAAARGPIPGLTAPTASEDTPWGVPAFFLGGGPRGDIAWNRFHELRGRLDLEIGAGHDWDLYVGGEAVRQRVETFQRVLGYLPVGDSVPPPVAADFRPTSGAAYVESRARTADLGLTVGLRYDWFDPQTSFPGGRIASRSSLNPRFTLSTVLAGATVVASWGRFSQAPDFQYMVDAAFDDTTRTGRFRVGNPSLGFEQSWQYEFSVRARPTPGMSLRVNAYYKRLEGLVASVPYGLNPDSTIFGNTDYGTVQGAEVLWEREVKDGWGVRIAYTLQRATATASNAFQLLQRVHIAPNGVDTVFPGRIDFPLDYDRRHGLLLIVQGQANERAGPRLAGIHPFGGFEGAAIMRWSSGLPFSRTTASGDTLIGLPNSFRLPSQFTIDALLRRPLAVGGARGSVYLDLRNLLNRANIVAVRRDTGNPGLGDRGIQAAAAAAYAAHPEAIPFESPRYRAWADTNHDGVISGGTELLPLYLAAARDFFQPLFTYGPPRLVRLGVELIF
jgi:outer membrane receptor protein involved in Fe transport